MDARYFNILQTRSVPILRTQPLFKPLALICLGPAFVNTTARQAGHDTVSMALEYAPADIPDGIREMRRLVGNTGKKRGENKGKPKPPLP